MDHNKLWKILKLWEYSRNLYAGQEATVSTAHGTMDWFKLGKRALQGYVLSPCLFNSHAESTMRNAGLDDSQAGSSLPGEILTISDMQMVPLEWQKAKRK